MKNSMTISEELIRERRQAIDTFLEDEYVLVHIDSRSANVNLPPHLMAHPSVTLKLSRLFRGAIELKVEQIETDLLFGDRYFSCVIPFAAIWGATNCDGNNVIWPESTPPEILQKIFVQTATEKKKGKEKELKPRKLAKPRTSEGYPDPTKDRASKKDKVAEPSAEKLRGPRYVIADPFSYLNVRQCFTCSCKLHPKDCISRR